jgi:dienelactone hydrolase
MKLPAALLVTSAVVLLSHVVTAQQPQPVGRGNVGSLMSAPADAPPPKSTPPGPHAVAIESYASLATHTVYHPANLGGFGPSNRLPIVSWGNGGCARVGTAFAGFLTQVASHGYVAIAVGAKDAVGRGGARGQAPAASGPAGTPPAAPAAPDDALLLDAIDWAIRQNGDPTSRLYQKLDTTEIAVMGQSCGGLQTIAVSHDPRITTSVLWNSGVLPPTATTPGLVLSAANKTSLGRLHAPVAYFIGGPTDVAYPNAEDDFARITTVPVFKANLNVGHGGTFRDPGAGWFGEVGVAWLDWQLKGQAEASRYFVGADCRLCTNSVWAVQKKGMQ